MDTRTDEFTLASRRGAERRDTAPAAIRARYDRRRGRIVILLSSGLEIAFHPGDARGLANATPEALSPIEISPSGQGLHFPALDADLYLPALLEEFLDARRWHAARMGRVGGRSTSKAKRTAARQNGKLGGRPRTKTAADAG